MKRKYPWKVNAFEWKPVDKDSSSYSSYDFSWGMNETCSEEDIEFLEDGPWSPLYEYEDYEGIAHQIMAEELGYIGGE